MAEQYLINDTTLTSIADAIRETGWVTNISDDEYSQGKFMLYSFRYNSVSYSCLENFLPETLYFDNGYINQLGMPKAIQGILGVPDLADFVARAPLSGIVTLGAGITKIRPYAFATSDYSLGTFTNNSVYKNISAFTMRDVTYIGDYAFQNWSALQSLYLFGSIVPSLGGMWWTGSSRDFRSQFSGRVYVPASMYDAYKNDSYWSYASLSSFYVASELGVRFLHSGSYTNFNSRYYSDATYGDQYLIDGNMLTAIASAIRGQLGVSTEYLPREMPSAIRQIGANDADMVSNIEGTIKSYSDRQSSVTMLSDYAFASCTELSSAVFPVCSSIRIGAFMYCRSLVYISAPLVASIDSEAFMDCERLSSISFPECTYLNWSAFCECFSLTGATLPECSNVGSRAFYNDQNLSSVSLPKCQYVMTSAFGLCYSLSTLSLPYCSALDSYAFARCSSLMSLYLMGSSVVRLYSSFGYVFSNTPMVNSTYTGSFGSIYVPTSLYARYSSSTYWSNYRSRLVSM